MPQRFIVGAHSHCFQRHRVIEDARWQAADLVVAEPPGSSRRDTSGKAQVGTDIPEITHRAEKHAHISSGTRRTLAFLLPFADINSKYYEGNFHE